MPTTNFIYFKFFYQEHYYVSKTIRILLFSDNDCQEKSMAVTTLPNLQDESLAAASIVNPPILSGFIASPTENVNTRD